MGTPGSALIKQRSLVRFQVAPQERFPAARSTSPPSVGIETSAESPAVHIEATCARNSGCASWVHALHIGFGRYSPLRQRNDRGLAPGQSQRESPAPR